MKVYRCANCSELIEEIIDNIENSAVICKGLRKTAVIENKVVKFDQPHQSEKKRSTRSKNKSKIIKERKEKFENYESIISKHEKTAQVISANKNYKRNIKNSMEKYL